MANEEHLKILKQGVDIWNLWRENNKGIIPDIINATLTGITLRGADLSWTDLGGANLRGTDLRSINFSESNLDGANIYEANLSGANLRLANLSNSDLRKANLSKANLFKANLREADLQSANLREADLTGADIRAANLSSGDLTRVKLSGTILNRTNFSETMVARTLFADVDLSEVIGLDTVRHFGPSTLGIDTIYKSKGNIPGTFLRGLGIPDNFIEYLQSLITGESIQFYSCFISYSTKDQGFAERLHADLQGKGVRIWFAPEDIQGGRKLHEQIPEAIRLYDKLLIVLSEASMQSEWVKTEIYHARQDEIRDKKRKLFPIGLVEFDKVRDWTAFDADVGKDMAREIREYFIPDFSNWKDHDCYKNAFDRLLRDLQAEE